MFFVQPLIIYVLSKKNIIQSHSREVFKDQLCFNFNDIFKENILFYNFWNENSFKYVGYKIFIKSKKKNTWKSVPWVSLIFMCSNVCIIEKARVNIYLQSSCSKQKSKPRGVFDAVFYIHPYVL